MADKFKKSMLRSVTKTGTNTISKVVQQKAGDIGAKVTNQLQDQASMHNDNHETASAMLIYYIASAIQHFGQTADDATAKASEVQVTVETDDDQEHESHLLHVGSVLEPICILYYLPCLASSKSYVI